MVTKVIILLILCMVTPAFAGDLKDGDIVFQTSRSEQSLAIQKATGSKYSHMGLVLYRNGNPYVYEAGAKVGYTPLAEWAERGVGGKFVARRLRNADRQLNGETLSKMRREAEKFRSKPYDPYFEWSDKRIYCSELVWKIYKQTLDVEIGRQQKLKEFNLSSPVVKKLLKKRYGKKIPYNEKVISPAAMFESKELVPVDVD